MSRRTGPEAVIVGMDDVRGLHAARALADRGVRVTGIANDTRSYGARTRACGRVIGADTGNGELIEALLMLGRELDEKAVLVPCFDTAVLNLSRHRDELERSYELALPPHDTVETLTDKIRFSELALELGFPVPRSRIVHSRDDAEQAGAELAFPCAVKPRTSKAPGWLDHTRLKAFKARNAAHLLTLYDHHAEHANGLIVQEWIEGGDESHFTCNGYFDAAGKPLVTFVSQKLRQWPPGTGEGSLSVECRADDIVAETLRFFGAIPYHGLAYLEFKRDAVSGRTLIVEPNVGRVTGRCALAEASGVPLLYTMYCDAAGLPLPENRDQQYRGTKWVWFRRDLLSGLHYWRRGELSLRAWASSLRGRKASATWSWRDPMPSLVDVTRALRLVLSPRERRKRSHAPLDVRSEEKPASASAAGDWRASSVRWAPQRRRCSTRNGLRRSETARRR